MKSNHQRLIRIGAAAVACATTLSVQATSITYDLSWNAGTQTGVFTYTVHNDALANPIEGFTIFFPEESMSPNIYTDVAIVAAPAGWSIDITPEDDLLSLSALVTGLANPGPEIGVGQSLAGLQIGFKYTGAGTPGSQLFWIHDAGFNNVDTGYTSQSASVPDAGGSVACLALAFGALAAARSRARIRAA